MPERFQPQTNANLDAISLATRELDLKQYELELKERELNKQSNSQQNNSERLKTQIALLAAVITAGQLAVAYLNYKSTAEKNGIDVDLSRRTYQETREKNKSDKDLSDAAFNRDMFQLVIERQQQLRQSQDFRTALSSIFGGLSPSRARDAIIASVWNAAPASKQGNEETRKRGNSNIPERIPGSKFRLAPCYLHSPLKGDTDGLREQSS